MAQSHPGEIGLAIFLLRALRGWTQTELAAAAGVTPSMVCEYERGRRVPSRKTLERLATTVGVPVTAVDRVLPALRSLQESSENGGSSRLPTEHATVTQLADLAETLRAAGELIFRENPVRREFTPHPTDRAEAPELWSRLRRYEVEDQMMLVGEVEEFQSWALCELVCHRSAELLHENPGRAGELARLALRIAQVIPGKDAWRSRVQGYAWAHLSGPLQASGDSDRAEEARFHAQRHWKTGASAFPGLLEERRLLEALR